jgi:hypothetical protein
VLQAIDVRKLAQSTATDPTSATEDKAAARKAIRRINNQAEITKGRPKRPKRKDYESDEAHNQALFEFRSFLDHAAIVREASKVLDDPASSSYMRRKARETLYGPDTAPAEPVKTPDSQVLERTPRSRLSADDSAEESARAQAFLDFIGKHGIPAETPKHELEPKRVEPPKPTVGRPELFCEHCRVSLKICGCDVIACPLCWHTKSSCYPPCPNSRRKS